MQRKKTFHIYFFIVLNGVYIILFIKIFLLIYLNINLLKYINIELYFMLIKCMSVLH